MCADMELVRAIYHGLRLRGTVPQKFEMVGAANASVPPIFGEVLESTK